jgi:hypothetical protein
MSEVASIMAVKKLNLPERIHLLGMLPQQGGVTDLRIVRELREQLSLTEEEHKEFGLTEETEGNTKTFHWTNMAAAMEPKPFELKPRALKILCDALMDLEKRKQLRTEHLSLWEIFIGE